jgi:leucyl-tRNA synthetase
MTAERFDPTTADQRWQRIWDERQSFRADDASTKPRSYVLEMFPYPSGRIHIGHVRNYTMGDVLARYKRMQGFEVLHPMGWDAFGMPAENAAMEKGVHPGGWTRDNIANMKAQLKRLGFALDWSRELATCEPDYYGHEQALFLDLYEGGLVYRKESAVNWDPVDMTVLANEQVIDGRGWRSGAIVEKRKLSQWFLKITQFADELLAGLSTLDGWPEKVRTMQENWIGKSQGLRARFNFIDSPSGIEVFTTRPDTLFGASFVAISPDHPLATQLAENAPELAAFIAECKQGGTTAAELETAEKKGFNTGLSVEHPLKKTWHLPVYVANFVLMDYGTGAVFACPAHDQRDLDFARKYDLPVTRVVAQPKDGGGDEDGLTFSGNEAYTGPGRIVNSEWLNGLTITEAKAAVIAKAKHDGWGEGETQYRLRDWGVSRQRYWGTPIPFIHCEACGVVPVPKEQLPVVLPEDVDFQTPGNPLLRHPTWKDVACPQCNEPAQRETDTLDTFVDSSWYFLRYCSPGYEDGPFDPQLVKAWMPADIYVGGVEHAVLHLLYARFFTKVLADMGLVDFREPFSAQLNQGFVINQGKKMSKSLGNGVRLGDQLAEFGVDAVRLTLVFAGPPEDDIDWADMSPHGSLRFLQRAWRLAGDVTSAPGTDPAGGDVALRRVTHHTVHDAAALVEAHRFNVMVARVMELVNATRKAIDKPIEEGGCGPDDPAVREAVEAVAVLLSLVAPYTAEDMWERLGHQPSVARAGWPVVEESLLVEESVVAVVQVQGKVRARLEVSPDVSDADLEAAAMADPAVQRALDGKAVRKVIVRAPKLVNIVAG